MVNKDFEKQLANKNKEIERTQINIETKKKQIKKEQEKLRKLLKEKEELESKFVLETLKANNMTIEDLKELFVEKN